MSEDIEIIQAIDGKLIAKASYGETSFTIELPSGFADWQDDEQRAHLKRYVVPRLKFLITRSRLNTINKDKFDPALTHRHFEADGTTPTKSKARDGLRATKKRLKLAN